MDGKKPWPWAIPCLNSSGTSIPWTLRNSPGVPINDRNFASETRDGKPGCKKLMGKFREYDRGETAFVFNPTNYILAFNDFALMVRFTPRDAVNTDVQFSWLVHRDAEEGVDYDPENLAWVWDVTTKQDKKITEGQ